MWVLSVLSSGLLLWVIYFIIKKNRNQYSVIFGLMIKILGGITLGLIYKYHYQGGDTFQYYSDAGVLAHYLLKNPQKIPDLLWDTSRYTELAHQIAYLNQPRALFFTKIITPIYILTGGSYWIMSILLSIINFMCVHEWVKELSRHYKNIYSFAALSFYFLPTFVFWTSGLLKESLAVGAFMILLAISFRMIRTGEYANIKYWFLAFISGILLWKLKYFYGAVAFPVLGTLLLFEFSSRKQHIPAYLIPLFLIFGIFIISFMHYNLGFSRISDVIYQNYLAGVESSDGKAIVFYHFDGSILGFLINLPLAIFSGLYRPLPFESTGLLAFMAGIENLILLILTCTGLWKVKNKLNFRDPVIWVTLVYIFILAVFLAFSTPNFGTLSRFKVGFWPFFVMLILVINQKKSG